MDSWRIIELPDRELALIGGSMGTISYMPAGTEQGMQLAYGFAMSWCGARHEQASGAAQLETERGR